MSYLFSRLSRDCCCELRRGPRKFLKLAVVKVRGIQPTFVINLKSWSKRALVEWSV